jgi:ABC-2 type transport system permease protein
VKQVRLFFDLWLFDLKAKAQYRADFVIGIVAALLQNVVALAVLWVVFRHIPTLGGWTLPQASLLYGLFALCMGLTNVLAGGLRRVISLVRHGEFDQYLVQPASAYVQLLPEVNLSAIGEVLLSLVIVGGALVASGLGWQPLTLLYLLGAAACGTAILIGFLTIIYSLTFWAPRTEMMPGLEEVREFARYPVSIYPRWVRILITWILPLGFASYVPAAAVTDAEAIPSWVMFMPPVAAVLMAGVGALLWREGLKRYEGTGN